jgi:GntR family transcriptional regulator, vanillate catabolism transcriptional regulator
MPKTIERAVCLPLYPSVFWGVTRCGRYPYAKASVPARSRVFEGAVKDPRSFLPVEANVLPRAGSRLDGSSQVEHALLSLREMLLTGELVPGNRIAEIPLAARLGVSRTPLRLALERLQHEGLAAAWPSGGFVVRSFTVADIRDAIELRGVLEGYAARRAAERLRDPADLEMLDARAAEMSALVRTGDPTWESFVRYIELNRAFHEGLVELACSPILQRSIDQVVSLPFASPSAFLHVQAEMPEMHEILFIATEHHRAIVEAIRNRQGARAESLLREHCQVARRNLEIVLRDRNMLNRLPGAALIEAPA